MRWKSLLYCGVLLICGFGAVQAQSRESLALVSGRPGGMCVYELRFVTPDTLLPEAALELVLPRPFDVSRVQLASSDVIKGGFAVHVSADTVRIVRSGRGPTVEPGVAVDLKVAAVDAPKAMPAGAMATVRIFPRGKQASHLVLVPVTNDTTRVIR
ncbi:MAG: hypothetical protein ONB30_03415 [candidate division KSB1 bacterium]|nr:hypothetical protein [candidate division KSB1 bacterium]